MDYWYVRIIGLNPFSNKIILEQLLYHESEEHYGLIPLVKDIDGDVLHRVCDILGWQRRGAVSHAVDNLLEEEDPEDIPTRRTYGRSQTAHPSRPLSHPLPSHPLPTRPPPSRSPPSHHPVRNEDVCSLSPENPQHDPYTTKCTTKRSFDCHGESMLQPPVNIREPKRQRLDYNERRSRQANITPEDPVRFNSSDWLPESRQAIPHIHSSRSRSQHTHQRGLTLDTSCTRRSNPRIVPQFIQGSSSRPQASLVQKPQSTFNQSTWAADDHVCNDLSMLEPLWEDNEDNLMDYGYDEHQDTEMDGEYLYNWEL